jgi:hypothetical protein
MNQFLTSFPTRDEAMDYIIRDANIFVRSMGDYEILDGSDFL